MRKESGMEYKRRGGDVLLRNVLFDECPMCDKTHEVEEWERIDTAIVQGQKDRRCHIRKKYSFARMRPMI